MGFGSFDELVARAARHGPYPFQARLAEEGLPEVLRVPTGAGKTLAAVLPWLFRRRFHPDQDVREATPRWLVYVLPQRTLVEQVRDDVQGWLANLGLSDQIGLHVLMGGEASDAWSSWWVFPERDAVFVGTQDMILSRLLMRGYAESRAAWPRSFGLLHSGAQFVFDEVQQMGPGLGTSLQLQGLREKLGTAAPSKSMWMSATVDVSQLSTVDFAHNPGSEVSLSDRDTQNPALQERLSGTRRVQQVEIDTKPAAYPRTVAELATAKHREGTRTIVVLNTVDRARAVYEALVKAKPEANLILAHSRFRPPERRGLLQRVTDEPGKEGTIVVSTQVLEAGVDLCSCVMISELASWSSIVQRAGRCNRCGQHRDARFIWLPLSDRLAAPYLPEELAASSRFLTELDGADVTSLDLQERRSTLLPAVYDVLRRQDLLDLYDTSADLSGNDVDVSRWIRDPDTSGCFVAWRDLDDQWQIDPRDWPRIGRDELCPAPIREVRTRVAGDKKTKPQPAVMYDPVQRVWRRVQPHELRPGTIVILDAVRGGYLSEVGWHPTSSEPVEPVTDSPGPPAATNENEDAAAQKPGLRPWVTLATHLDDTKQQAEKLAAELTTTDLTRSHMDAAVSAALHHDVGKAHPVYGRALAQVSADGQVPDDDLVWAKSPTAGTTPLRYEVPRFRHDLVTAIMLLDPALGLLAEEQEPDLVAYLAAAHHGKVRLTVRAMPDESSDDQNPPRILGVESDSTTVQFRLPDGRVVPPSVMRLDAFQLGSSAVGDSWQTRTQRLLLREDLGPFRLGFLEAFVRAADARASARPGEAT